MRHVALAVALFLSIGASMQPNLAAQQPAAARTPKAAAPFDPSGYWVPLITEDWRFRMLTPPKAPCPWQRGVGTRCGHLRYQGA